MKIAVFGAGLVGSLYSVLMLKLGHEVTIYEKRNDPRKGVSGRARSINLALSTRGWKALELAGLKEKVEEIVIPMDGRMIHTVGKEPRFSPYSQYGKSIYSVSRNMLNELLIAEAEKYTKCTFVFNASVPEPNDSNEKLKVVYENGTEEYPSADWYIGADGANSRVRSYIKGCKFSLEKISHSYKEIEIPAGGNGAWSLFKNALHIWPRGTFMFIGLPNLDATYTGTLFMPTEGENSFSELSTPQKTKEFLETTFPDAYKKVPDMVSQFYENPTSHLSTVWADDWYDEEKNIGLIGDSAHGIVPFYGQGMNAGFEDCTILYEALKSGVSFKDHFIKYAQTRKKDTDAIAQLAMDNFIEMRDLVAQPRFMLQKKIEATFQEKYSHTWMPLYSMVSFSNLPYSEVYERGKVQQKIMDEVLDLPEIEKKWLEPQLHSEIKHILAKYHVIS